VPETQPVLKIGDDITVGWSGPCTLATSLHEGVLHVLWSQYCKRDMLDEGALQAQVFEIEGDLVKALFYCRHCNQLHLEALNDYIYVPPFVGCIPFLRECIFIEMKPGWREGTFESL